MMKNTAIVLVSLFFSFYNNAQVTYYEEIYRGGICFSGFSAGLADGNGNFDTYIEPGSVVKKIFLIYNIHGEPDQNVQISIDGINYSLPNESFNNQSYLENQFTNDYKFKINILDISSTFLPQNSHSFTIPNQTFLNCGFNCFYGNFGILILYENINLNPCSIALILNNQDLNTFNTDYSALVNPININFPVAFSVNSDIIADQVYFDGTDVYFEGVHLGLIGGADNVNPLSIYGTRGHFYYQSNSIFGLDDDTNDALMTESDALAEISSYVNSNTQLNWRMAWQNQSVGQNTYTSFVFAYTTPCDTFSVSVPPDTTICRGESLQLNVVGGSQYEWLPATDLSCSTCPNPVFTGDSTQLYTVRIWNNDSCSVVRPVKITVRKQPNFGAINLTPTICGTNSGSIVAGSLSGNLPPISYMLNGGTAQTSGSFSNLSAGLQTITLQDGFGCERDSVVTIGQANTTIAQFSANPSIGAVPLSVSLSNSSVFADQFLWSLNGITQGNSFPNFTATQTGSYLIELIAWQFDPACADTATLTISAFDSLMVHVPNIITANNDLVNDFFTVNTNLPLKGKVTILNRWGEVVYAYDGKLQLGQTQLWDGKFKGSEVMEGTYFYAIELQEDPEIPLAIDKNQLPVKMEGFVAVRR